MTKSEILKLLDDTQTATLRYFDLKEEELLKNYGEGKWNIRQILHHLTDVEYMLHSRLKKIIAEPRQVVWAFDPDEWNRAFDYSYASLDGKKQLYLIFRQMNYELTENYFDGFFQKEFVHNLTGLRTLAMEFEKVATHNESHNKQIEIALSK